MPRSLRCALGTVLAVLLLLAGCGGSLDARHAASRPVSPTGPTADSHVSGVPEDEHAHGLVTLAFAGDLHFQLHLAALLEHPRGALGPIAETLKASDVAMVNLESAITTRGTLEAKELEEPSERYYFRTSPAVLRVLAAAGIDVATMANNHGADYGPVGLADTLRAIRRGPLAVVGVGRNRAAAFAPYLISVRGTHIAFLAGDASMREGSSSVWEAGPTSAGIAAAHKARPRALLAAVRKAAGTADVVVVYMHWGEEMHGCPTQQQRTLARLLAEAGADVVLGSHAHLLQGAGWLGRTYVGYGLGNFVWYHDHQPETGVLTLRIRDGMVVADEWTPARIHDDGIPRPLSRPTRPAAVAAWNRLRGCTNLAPLPRVPDDVAEQLAEDPEQAPDLAAQSTSGSMTERQD